MLFFFVRHGEPIYNPDSLTDLGKQQAQALAKRFERKGLDRIYCSTSDRAIMTAEPTLKALGKTPMLLNWAHESIAWQYMSVEEGEGRTWVFHKKEYVELLNSPEIASMGKNWVEHPEFEWRRFREAGWYYEKEFSDFFTSLGYKYNEKDGSFKVVKENKERVALFAHQGFGFLFLSWITNIPYPLFSTRFDFGHSSVTTISFEGAKGEKSYPKILQVSDLSHLYKEDILNPYNGKTEIF